MLRCSKNIATSQEAIMVDLPRCMAIMISIRRTYLLNLFDVYLILTLLNRPGRDCGKMQEGTGFTVHAFMITREFIDITKSTKPGV